MVTGTVWDGMRMRPRSMKSKSRSAMPSSTRTSEADAPLFLEDGAEGLRDVAVEHDVDRLSMFDGVSQAKRDRASKG